MHVRKANILQRIISRCAGMNLKQTCNLAQHNPLHKLKRCREEWPNIIKPLFITSQNIFFNLFHICPQPCLLHAGPRVDRMCRLKGPLKTQWHCILYYRRVWWSCGAAARCNPSWWHKQYEGFWQWKPECAYCTPLRDALSVDCYCMPLIQCWFTVMGHRIYYINMLNAETSHSNICSRGFKNAFKMNWFLKWK